MTHSLIGTSQELIIEREMEADRSSESSKTPQTEEPLESSNNESIGSYFKLKNYFFKIKALGIVLRVKNYMMYYMVTH